MTEGDLGDVNLLEWSHELDRTLLGHAFRPLRSSMDDKNACFLYKFAYSTLRKEVGFLLLDCDACNAFYEGLSLRTLDRRTKIESDGTTDFDEADHLVQIHTIIQHALDPRTALDPDLKTTIGIETTRFSSSMSISVKSKTNSARDLKTSFDLDPLDHTSSSNMISSHFVKPLLSLAAVLSRSASQQQLDHVQQHRNSESTATISDDSLELLRRAALATANLPVKSLRPLSTDRSDQTAQSPSPVAHYHLPVPLPASTHLEQLGDLSDMVFFGPPGLKAPEGSQHTSESIPAKEDERQRRSSPVMSSDSDAGEADRTLTQPIANSISHGMEDRANSSVFGETKQKVLLDNADDQDESDTSEEEESLPLAGNHKSDDESQLPSSSPRRLVPKPPSLQQEPNAISTASRPKASPEMVAQPDPSTSPSAAQISQTSNTSRYSEREEQQRRRQEIARIKRGVSDQQALLANTPTSSNGASAKSSAASRKRARF